MMRSPLPACASACMRNVGDGLVSDIRSMVALWVSNWVECVCQWLMSAITPL